LEVVVAAAAAMEVALVQVDLEPARVCPLLLALNTQ
jgi:hypothetical protein